MYPTATDRSVSHRSGSSGLAELFEVILDRGLVIDAYVRISLIGIELVTIDARIVIASVDTYLHFAEAVNRLDLRNNSSAWSISDLGDMGDEAIDKAEGSLKDSIPFMSSQEEGEKQKS